MLNNFDKCKSGCEAISMALQSMTDLAQNINEMKRQHERAVHIQEIQSTLFGWDGDDLTTYGTLVLEVCTVCTQHNFIIISSHCQQNDNGKYCYFKKKRTTLFCIFVILGPCHAISLDHFHKSNLVLYGN